MSDEENPVLHAQLKDGQLQIVEVNPYDAESQSQVRSMPDLNSESSSDNEPKFVLDSQKGLVPLDLLNFSLVRCEDTYQLVSNKEVNKSGDDVAAGQGITCVLQASETNVTDNQETYVMVDNERCPVLFLQSSAADKDKSEPELPSVEEDKSDSNEPKALTPEELIEKAREMAKTLAPRAGGARGRKRKGDLPPAHELLSSPNFKLYLYSCKLCSFKCNAIKELTAHKAAEHGGGRYRGAGKAGPALQCARCPYRAATHHQLMRHVQDKHLSETTETETMNLDSIEAEIADVLVCGACGFESSSKVQFKKHIEKHIDKRSS